MSSSRVCIVILNWNGLADTQECLRSLQRLTYPNREVILVDNASTGDDVPQLQREFGNSIRIVRNEKNYGFAAGNNAGIRYALDHSSLDYVFLLNNDTVVAPDFLDELVRAAEANPNAGILGPKIYYYDFDGRKDVIWAAGGRIRWWHPWFYHTTGQGHDDLPKYQKLRAVPWISGAAIMIKLQVLEQISLLNAEYFLGGEDVEYCLKARAHGFKCLYVPAARIWHKVGRSRLKHGPRFADLPDYFRLLRRNTSLPFYGFHLLLSPLLVPTRILSLLRDVLSTPRRPGP